MLEGIKGVSTYANDVDTAFIVVTVITLFLFIITIGSMLYFVYRYQASKSAPEDTKNIKHYTPIEIAWTVIPTILMMIVFYFGLESLRVQRTMPKDDEALIVKVLAQRWSWQFEYQNGKKSAELTVPLNQKVKLIMTAPEQDVLHSFYVPAFRAKEDIIPGQITYLWFSATKKGRYDIQCAEYCGTRHSYMRSFVNVVSKDEYKEFIQPPKKEVTKSAKELFNDYGCVGCHSLDGTPLVGPSFKDSYGKEVTVITKGVKRVIKRDENYLRNSILNPNDDIVEGYVANMMPSFKEQLSKEDLQTILNYFTGLKTTIAKETKVPALNGEEIILNNGCTGCHSLDGTRVVGPSFKDIFNRQTKVSKEGKLIEVQANEVYLKDAIINPKKEVVDGYPNIMPSFQGILSEEELDAVIEYLKTVK